MLKHLRTLYAVFFMVSMFSLVGCRNNYSNNCCEPCYETPRFQQNCAPGGPRGPIGSPRGEMAPMPRSPEDNPYCPCDPTFGCGNGGCGATPSIPDEVCFRNMKTYSTCDDCVVDLVQRAPEFATVGSPYPIEIYITARKECAEVQVTQRLPSDSMFVRAEPSTNVQGADACGQGGDLVWSFPHMEQGETQRLVIWVKPMKEGCCLAEATICACPQLCAWTRCGQPVVCIKKYGPACACLLCPVPYCIEVCNSGSATAYDVVAQDIVPDGLTHASGFNTLTYELGALAPGENKRVTVEFCAAKRGCVTNVATVSYCGGPKCTAEATTLINEPCVHVTKTGPDWAYICKIVDYTITVTNPGDLVLRDVVVEDISASGTTIVEAPGGEICCNKAVFCICELCPGETKTFTVSVRSQVTGCLTNKVSVTSQSDCGQCTMCAEAVTNWRGIAATHMCMVDTVDPICVGESTVYRICITNRGSADDTNVRLSVRFTNELEPQGVNGPTAGSIDGQTVTFDPIPVLAPKGCVEYAITVKGVAAGDAKAEATLMSDTLSSPDIDTESTHVY